MTDRLVGFCLLIKREVIQKVGLLDERFGIGNFEDDDYCRRAIAAGYRCLIAQDAFIHHAGSATFHGSGTDLHALLQTNQRLYEEKWHEQVNADKQPEQVTPARVGWSPFRLEANAKGELLLQPNSIKLSACLIVRDNEKTIRPCLESLRPWVDELIVVDTGSQDQTPQICQDLGATVHHWPWRDSFALARNESFRHAKGEWIFWMDSDDTLPDECGRKLRELVDGPHTKNILGYVMQVHCPGITPHDVTAVDHIKLIRNRADLEFEFRIHEQILPSIRRAGGDVAWTDLYVVHSGSDHSEAGHLRKLQRDFRLLELDLQERPDHPFVLFNLGMTHADAGQHEQAVRYLRRCLEVSGLEESHLRKAYALLIGSLMQSGRNEDAQHCCMKGLQLFPDDKELLFRQAMLFHISGQLRQADRLISVSCRRTLSDILPVWISVSRTTKPDTIWRSCMKIWADTTSLNKSGRTFYNPDRTMPRRLKPCGVIPNVTHEVSNTPIDNNGKAVALGPSKNQTMPNPSVYCGPYPKLYNTGEDQGGSTTDPHGASCNTDQKWSGPNLITNPFPYWVSSNWLSTVCDSDGPDGDPSLTPEIDDYSFKLDVEIDPRIVDTLSVFGRFAADNFLFALKVNGNDVPGVPLGGVGNWQFAGWVGFVIPPGNWVPGSNTIEFVVQNNSLPNVTTTSPMGLAVEWTGCSY